MFYKKINRLFIIRLTYFFIMFFFIRYPLFDININPNKYDRNDLYEPIHLFKQISLIFCFCGNLSEFYFEINFTFTFIVK